MGQKYSTSLAASSSRPSTGRVHFSQYAFSVLQLPITTPTIAKRTKNRRRAWSVFKTCQVFRQKPCFWGGPEGSLISTVSEGGGGRELLISDISRFSLVGTVNTRTTNLP